MSHSFVQRSIRRFTALALGAVCVYGAALASEQASAQTTSCQMTVNTCPAHPTTIGTFSDNYLNAGSDQTECMKRPGDYYAYCASNGDEPVVAKAIYLVNGTAAQVLKYPARYSNSIIYDLRTSCQAFVAFNGTTCNGIVNSDVKNTCLAGNTFSGSWCNGVYDPDMKNYCQAVQGHNGTYCNNILYGDLKNVCFATVGHNATTCAYVGNLDLKNFCNGVASYNGSACSAIQ